MKKYLILLTALCVAASAFSFQAGAVEPKEMLKDPALESRAREVSKQLRCVQCQNETIDESNAEIARDMRVLVRDRITAGETNEQVVEYMRSRYGDYVLLRPRFTAGTLALWIGPFALLLIGGFIVAARIKQGGRAIAATAPLSAEEQATLDAFKDSGDRTP
jgi:cytochrome c-type biogenesis protein CcmH